MQWLPLNMISVNVIMLANVITFSDKKVFFGFIFTGHYYHLVNVNCLSLTQSHLIKRLPLHLLLWMFYH